MQRKNNMKRVRFHRDLSQDELAVSSGYSQALISRLERGLLLPTPGTEKMKMRISSVLGFPVNKIFPEG